MYSCPLFAWYTSPRVLPATIAENGSAIAVLATSIPDHGGRLLARFDAKDAKHGRQPLRFDDDDHARSCRTRTDFRDQSPALAAILYMRRRIGSRGTRSDQGDDRSDHF